jgi:hypothetical protein
VYCNPNHTYTHTNSNVSSGSLYIYCSRIKEALIVKLLQTVLQENEDYQNLAGDLLKKCFEEKVLTKEDISKVC